MPKRDFHNVSLPMNRRRRVVIQARIGVSRLLRCTGATCTSWTTLATLPVTTTTYRDYSVRSGTTYRYLLIAVYLSVTAETIVKVKAR